MLVVQTQASYLKFKSFTSICCLNLAKTFAELNMFIPTVLFQQFIIMKLFNTE